MKPSRSTFAGTSRQGRRSGQAARRGRGAEVKISISITAHPGGTAAATAQLADLAWATDEAGLHTIWATDHLIPK
jgi:hypothetical protein